MKITKTQLRQIIKEELNKELAEASEAETQLRKRYKEISAKLDAGEKLTSDENREYLRIAAALDPVKEGMDDREVLIPGFGKLTLKQIETRLVDMLKDAGEGAMEEPPDFYNLRTGMIQAFYEAYRKHKGEEQLEEIKASMMGTDYASFPPRDFEYKGEGSMAVNQLHRTEEIANMLQDMISKEDNLEEWVESKITKAQDYLSSVLNYMSGKRKQVAEAEEGDFDPEARINQLGADPNEPEAEEDQEEAKLMRLRDEITKLLDDPDEADIKTARDKLGGYVPKKES
tara:strand:+ start:96 stop:953 length:858 start_codon:yes stop_codon:yes gene_type:complete